MRKNKGFTLIELLVVVAIIGLLASVVLASLSTARESARDAQRISDMGQMKTALELYYNSCGQYPPATSTYLDGSEFNGNCTGGTNGTALDEFIDPPEAPTGSANGYTYVPVSAGGDNVGYCLAADLEDDEHAQANSHGEVCEVAVTPTDGYDYHVSP